MADQKFNVRDNVSATRDLNSTSGKKIKFGSRGVVSSVSDFGRVADVVFTDGLMFKRARMNEDVIPLAGKDSRHSEKFGKGDEVRTLRDISRNGKKAPKGTLGVVAQVRMFGSLDVVFNNGDTLEVSPKDLLLVKKK